jgi:hypothetical protein
MGIGCDGWVCILTAVDGNDPALTGDMEDLGRVHRADAGVVGDLKVGVEIDASAGEWMAEEKMEAGSAGDASIACPLREVLMDKVSGDSIECTTWYGEDEVRWVDEEIGKEIVDDRS